MKDNRQLGVPGSSKGALVDICTAYRIMNDDCDNSDIINIESLSNKDHNHTYDGSTVIDHHQF